MNERPHYSLAQLALYFFNLGSVGFGGPVALVGYMYRDLVEKRHWISDDDYKEGLTLAQLMPGPLAAQLAMYLGYVHFRIVGATVVCAGCRPSFMASVPRSSASSPSVPTSSPPRISARTNCYGRSTSSPRASPCGRNQKAFGCSWALACWCGSCERRRNAGSARALPPAS